MRRKTFEALKKWKNEIKSGQIKSNPAQPHGLGLGEPESEHMEMHPAQDTYARHILGSKTKTVTKI